MDQDVFAQKPNPGDPWDIVIIGSGPAGLTAAVYTTRGAASTLIIGGESWGGQLMLTTTVDNFPGFPEGVQGPELMQKMRKQAERFGAQFLEKNGQSIDFTKKPFEITAGDQKYTAKAVIIATGADVKWLGVPGEKELLGRGVSTCAPCDAPFFKNKKVAVVGGGDAAMEEALILTKYASEVIIIHRRHELRASKAMQEKVFNNSKIKILWDTVVTKIDGTNKVESLSLSNQITKQTEQLPVDGVFVAVGHAPATQIFTDGIEIDEKGYAVRKPFEGNYHSLTNIPGVFVAGDVHDFHYRQAITAAGFGCQAGMDALKYLEELKESS